MEIITIKIGNTGISPGNEFLSKALERVKAAHDRGDVSRGIYCDMLQEIKETLTEMRGQSEQEVNVESA